MSEKTVDIDQKYKQKVRMWQNFPLSPYGLTSYVNNLLTLQNILEKKSSESYY